MRPIPRENLLKDRVAHAYFKYGRFCSSHPVLCMLVSIFTLLFLSYPVTRLRLPTSSPLDVYWADNTFDTLGKRSDKPDWLTNPPKLYIQQILLRPKILPWDSKRIKSAELAVKGALSRSFMLKERLNTLSFGSKSLEKFCLIVNDAPATDLLPVRDCMVLSPALLWQNDLQKFYEDGEILKTIFAPSCTSAMCVRDLLFGLPTRMTGFKRQYRTNRERSIYYAFTLVLVHYDSEFWNNLRDYFNSSSADFLLADSETENKFVHIFYRSRKELSEYIPLAVSYVVLLIYVYFSVSKIEMVKSRWGLAFSAVFTVAASLIMAAGICFQFDLTPTLWGAELFPYLAMIVGLENTLCITRSVVWTPVSLDVRSRIAHGLSKEGWSITKNFLTELLIIFVGFFTFVPEIQEFCTFACIGLVVDFYMQLFFYAPCLTFDLFRMDPEDKDAVQLRHLTGSPVELDVYQETQCPVARLFPRFFPKDKSYPTGEGMTRVRSDSEIIRNGLKSAESKSGAVQAHRRTASNTSDIFVNVEPRHVLRVLPTQVPRRLRVLYFWARTRFFQRFIMVVTVLWIVWLAFIVHELQLIEQVSSVFRRSDIDSNEKAAPLTEGSVSNSGQAPKSFQSLAASFRETAPLEWGSWQRRTFKWWPVLFDQYNLSLSGQYLTILPPVILKAPLSPDDPSILASGGHEKEPESLGKSGQSIPTEEKKSENTGFSSFLPHSDLPLKISWLELQMRIVLVMSCGIFATVAAFIVYVCFAGRGSSRTDDAQWIREGRRTHKRVGSKAIVESLPLVFAGHKQDVECLSLCNKDVVVSSCLGGNIRIWDAKTGDCIKKFDRLPASPSRSRSSTTPQENSLDGHGPTVESPDRGLRRRNVIVERSNNEANQQPFARNPVNGVNRQIHENRNGGYDFTPFIPGHPPGPNEDSVTNRRPPPLIVDLDSEELRNTPIWCLAAHNNLVVAGCANGMLELYSASGNLIGYFGGAKPPPEQQALHGVNQVCIKGSRLVIARLNGILEFIEMKLVHREGSSSSAEPSIQCNLLRQMRAHQRPLNCLKIASSNVVVTGSADHTLKLLDLRTCRPLHTLYGHNGAVMTVCVDEILQVIYSSCDQGLICCWDLLDGTLLRTLPEASYTNSPVALAVTSTLLVAYSNDCHLWLWKKRTGELVTRIRRECTDESKPNLAGNSKKEKLSKRSNSYANSNNFNTGTSAEVPCLVVLEDCDDFAVTACAGHLQFWSLQYKILLREVKLETDGAPAQKLLMLGSESPSVVCSMGKELYRVNFPIIKFR